MNSNLKKIRIPVVRARIFGVNLYRGYASLSFLADISKPDIYNQQSNPQGTQRDLNEAHAKDAYKYAKDRIMGFWPEIFLCARDNSVLTYFPISDEFTDCGYIEIDIDKIKTNTEEILISRIDGNHRLHFSNGEIKGYPRLDQEVSFCMSFNLSIEEEIMLFKDINKNQKPMNTSHLDTIEVRLSNEDELVKKSPSLYIANKLSEEENSPLKNLVSKSTKKVTSNFIPLRSLHVGIEYLLSKSIQLPRLDNIQAQYKLIENYLNAVKQWQPKPFEEHKKYLMLRGVGLWSICLIGSYIIDTSINNKEFSVEYMLNLLNSGKIWDWSNNGDFKGYSGKGGANEISNKITREIKSRNGQSIDEMISEILKVK